MRQESAKKKKDETFALTVGSQYRLRSIESRSESLVTSGIFRGFATIGQETGVAIEMDESHGEERGKLRIIPLHVILSVDVLRAKEVESEAEEASDAVYFG